ncbi:DUF4384 domain-containing protein [Epibacterium ulvae]|uniref:DUF4384 domain-containing protein n=1 Tax=Epibacterium ulvae TaxID=1156985 RepID=UPI001BFCA358|nr:DUF4384 domain-containing protein [Epibacterium ulvae]MBT8155456.1 DUF4384 domain-containing protein [Epibacterium ulvae]
MRHRTSLWALALGGSLAFHAAVVMVAWQQFNARPIAPQPTVTSQLSVHSEPVRQDSAQARDTSGDATPAQDTQGQSLTSGAVPLSTAPALAPHTTPLTAVTDPSTPLTASASPVATSQPAALPSISASAVTAPTAQLAATRLPVADLPAQRPVTATLAASTAPVVQAAALTNTGAQIPLAAIAGDTTTTLAPPSQTLVVQTPSGQAIKAELAFQGESQDIDAQSLAAFQSFTQPGDLSAQSDPLRDGVAQILAQVPCSRLQVEFDPDSTTLNVRGHLPDPGLKAPVLALLQQQMGSNIAVSDKMALLPRPQCGALQAIQSVGLPQSTDQITNPALLGADAHVKTFDFRAGDLLFLDLTGPDYPAHVYVDYLDAAGNVLHLSPNEHAPLIELREKQPFSVGARAGQTTGLQLLIAPPFGREIVVAFAASHPLYDGNRPLIEPAAPYLDWLTNRVADMRATHPDFKGEWVYFLVSTGP